MRIHKIIYKSFFTIFLLLSLYLFDSATSQLKNTKITIASKRFTESYIVGEILKQLAEKVNEAPVNYRQGLGNTGIVYAALQEGLIDIYPEYTGTIADEILNRPELSSAQSAEINFYLKPLGLAVTPSLGFHDNYALAMLETRANALGINKISDLAAHQNLRFGFSHEFIGRSDGWKGLKKSGYKFPSATVKAIDYSLSYEALKQNKIDLIDTYTTDPKIIVNHLKILEDDLHFFPLYEGVLLYRIEASKAFPETWRAFEKLKDSLSTKEIITLNSQAELKGIPFQEIAKAYFNQTYIVPQESSVRTLWNRLMANDLWLLTQQHLFLVFGALIPAILVGLFLGIISYHRRFARHIILNGVSMIQTIPSLALLAFLIPIFKEIGTLPALIALFLYSLLPIVRNTYAGLTSISNNLHDATLASGLPFLQRLLLIEIPLASPMILTGIKTAAVLNVGMATVAALIGAGGYGVRIIEGLAINDYTTLLAGAIPACILAVFVQIMFELIDYFLIPRGLKIHSS